MSVDRGSVALPVKRREIQKGTDAYLSFYTCIYVVDFLHISNKYALHAP